MNRIYSVAAEKSRICGLKSVWIGASISQNGPWGSCLADLRLLWPSERSGGVPWGPRGPSPPRTALEVAVTTTWEGYRASISLLRKHDSRPVTDWETASGVPQKLVPECPPEGTGCPGGCQGWSIGRFDPSERSPDTFERIPPRKPLCRSVA